MSLRILFADDSMTAQNMGKKILTDAGYDVIAVSNGAAAVKKIAEHKPDIIILDVYMPGYTGLEVCEKVRASIETVKTPVLLTVGKMEPYRAEDANRVKADGVIIKPFEASDLIAIVKKLEERVSPKAQPVGDQTILLDRPPDFSQFAAAAGAPVAVAEAPAPPVHAPIDLSENTVQATVEVPDHMASSSAFSDLLGTEPVQTLESFAVVPSNHTEIHAVSEPAYEMASSFTATPEIEAVAAVPEFEMHAAAPAPSLEINLVHSSGAVEVEPAEESISDHQPVPAFEAQSAAEIPVPHDPAFEGASSAEVATIPDPALQPSFAEQGRAEVPSAIDPGLLAESAALESFPTKFGMEHADEVPVGVAADLPDFSPVFTEPETSAIQVENELHHSAAAHHDAAASEVTEDDFDARVAAALAAYDQEAAEIEAAPAESEHQTEQQPHLQAEMPVSFEYVPPVSTPEHSPVEAEAAHDDASASAVAPVRHESEPPTAVIARKVFEETETAQAKTEEEIVADIEAEMPMAAAAAASQSGSDHHHVIADIVHRVMERFKPELIAEIVRELNSKK